MLWGVASEMAVQMHIAVCLTAAGQYFTRRDKGQWLLWITHLSGKQFEAAGTAITTATLVFDFVSGAFQPF